MLRHVSVLRPSPGSYIFLAKVTLEIVTNFSIYILKSIRNYPFRYEGTYVCLSIYVCIYIYTYIYVYICMYIYIYMCIYMYIYIYTYIYTYICVYIYMCIYTHIHTFLYNMTCCNTTPCLQNRIKL